MDKRLGSSAGILALIALLLHTFGQSEGQNSAKPAGKDVAASSGSAADVKDLQLLDKQGPWRATQQYFHSDLVSSEGRACQDYLLGLPTPKCSQQGLRSLFGFEPGFDLANLRFLLAMIADPLHTRMSIETDRDLDAIQRAAYRSGWELATQWLPWTAKSGGGQVKSAGKEGSVDLETFPGVLVFRRHFEPDAHPEQLLLVLVVAETPTAGINGFQFEAARRTFSLFGLPERRDIFIAGPRFSGSFLSMTHLLESWPPPQNFVVQSGSVSNSDYARAMLADFASKQRAQRSTQGLASSITFHGSTLPSVAFEHHFASLVSRLNLRPDQAAKLIEDETGFSVPTEPDARRILGAATATDPKAVPDPIPVYRYPRDIAQVRNNYNDAAFAPSGMKGDNGAVPAVEFSLKDTQAGEDIFPMFSTGHTPVSQNAELQQTVQYLKRKRVRIASLSATNVFDTIFLANVLSRTCPDIRIVVRGPDLLFVQEASQGSLSGLLAISPFPMFPEGGIWSHADTHDETAFSSADQIGEFNAVVTLLQQQQESTHSRKTEFQRTEVPAIQPYEQAFDGNRDSVMSAWLLQLGPTGWLPIDFLPQVNPVLASATKDRWFHDRDLPASRAASLNEPVRVRVGWIGLCALFALFTIAFCGRLIYLYFQPHKLVWSNLCIVDLQGWASSRGMPAVVHQRYICMICCFSTLAFVNGLLLCPMVAMSVHHRVTADFRVTYLVGAAFVAAWLVAFYLSVSIPVRVRGTAGSDARVAPESIVTRIVVLAIPFIATFVWWICCTSGNAGYLMCFRVFSLSAPLSPVWPLLISGCGLFALCYFHLRRFTWAYRRQPHLDTSLFDQLLPSEFGRLKEGLEQTLYRLPAFARFPVLPRSLLVALAVILIFYGLIQEYGLNSFEPNGFTQIFEYVQVPLAVFTLVTFKRFLRSWSLLRALLVSLNSVVLGRFFERVPEFGGSGPVWVREMKFVSLASAVNSTIALKNLSQIGFGVNYATSYLNSLRNFLSVSECAAGTRLKFIRRFDVFRRKANMISAELGVSVIQPYWRDNVLPYVGSVSTEAAASATPKMAAGPAPLLSLAAAAGGISAVPNPLSTAEARANSGPSPISPEAYEYASKYVALQYSVFIGYVLLHLQNLLICSTVCFVFIVVALNSFVFQISQLVSYVLMGSLVAAAVVGLIVLAQMERDPILSRMSGTQEGVLGRDFYWRAIAYGAIPVFSILSTQFPAISRFVSSWVEPALSKLQ